MCGWSAAIHCLCWANMTIFSLNVMQAINDWQRGGDHRQKVRRGKGLKIACADLPRELRNCDVICYRQESHEKDRVWQLLADNSLPETVAAWTTDITVAKDFKGGVPPAGYQGVIFSIRPSQESIIVNLEAVYERSDFQEACEKYKGQIDCYHDGIGKYGNTQKEVVLELGSLSKAEILSYGGYSSSREVVAALFFGRTPTVEDLEVFDELCGRAGLAAGSWWLSEPGTRAVLKRMQPHIERLKGAKT